MGLENTPPDIGDIPVGLGGRKASALIGSDGELRGVQPPLSSASECEASENGDGDCEDLDDPRTPETAEAIYYEGQNVWVCNKSCLDHNEKCRLKLKKNDEGKLEPHFGSCWCNACEREDRDRTYCR